LHRVASIEQAGHAGSTKDGQECPSYYNNETAAGAMSLWEKLEMVVFTRFRAHAQVRTGKRLSEFLQENFTILGIMN
jgi:hypothetical protein